MDLAFTHAGAPGISLWRNVGGKKLERVKLPDFGWQRGWGISSIDYDNDGWLDILAAGESASGGESCGCCAIWGLKVGQTSPKKFDSTP